MVVALESVPLEDVPKIDCIEPRKDEKYYLENVAFQVENGRFLVPKHYFLQSGIFNSMEGMCKMEDSEEHMIFLSGVSKVDFVALLRLIYSPAQSAKLSSQEWESILKLTTKWRMTAFRKMAIDALSSMSVSPSERIRLGREYGNPHWLLSGYTDLVKREEALTIEEFRSLGIKNAFVLSQDLRRRYKKHMANSTLYDPKSTNTPFKNVVDSLFHDNIHEGSTSVDIVDRILLAQTYGISEWIAAGYFDLAARQKDITIEEGNKLGLEVTVKICEAREKVDFGASSSFTVEKEEERSFATDLNEARKASILHGDPVASESVVVLEKKQNLSDESKSESEPTAKALPASTSSFVFMNTTHLSSKAPASARRR